VTGPPLPPQMTTYHARQLLTLYVSCLWVCVCVSACVSVCLSVYLRACLKFTKFSVYTVAYCRGSDLLRWRCDALSYVVFVNDVKFFLLQWTLCRRDARLQCRCSVAGGLTPLLCGVGCVVSQTTAGGKT